MANNTAPEKRWYVFDEYDCFTSFSYEDGMKAMDVAVGLERQGLDGMHVVCMTPAQFNAYCEHGDLRKAMKK